MAETVKVEDQELWKVFVNSSTNKKGSGVDVILISSQGKEIKLVVCLQFRLMNNEVEYEALLIGLKATRNVRVD